MSIIMYKLGQSLMFQKSKDLIQINQDCCSNRLNELP